MPDLSATPYAGRRDRPTPRLTRFSNSARALVSRAAARARGRRSSWTAAMHAIKYDKGLSIEADVRAGAQTALAAAIDASPEHLFAYLEQLSVLATDAYVNTLVEEILDRVAWGVSVVENLIGPDVIVLSGYVLAGRTSWRDRILKKSRLYTLYGETAGIHLEFPRLKPEDYLGELARSSYFRAPKQS